MLYQSQIYIYIYKLNIDSNRKNDEIFKMYRTKKKVSIKNFLV